MRKIPSPAAELPVRDEETERAINAALEECRPYLQQDGGDVELVRYEVETQTAEIRFLGACADCPLVLMTLRAGIERFVQLRVSAVRRMELVR
ncbi:MAG: NifU family protein [Chlorobiota bacterium]|jgi:Fe-S cluster biogenesis protein NfuA|nr:MAG: NifU family protein [Chlorobiota bacterium]